MPFSFLSPWFLLGGLALAVPVWLHLRRKRETNLVYFSALRFLDDMPEPRRSPWRLRDVLLFILRALAVALVVGAFAWPYLRNADTVPIKESRVYILDNTLSHQAGDGFRRDRDRVASEMVKAGLDIQMAAVELTMSPRVVVAFGDDRETAQKKVKELQPSFQRGSYLAAFRQASALLASSLGERKRIILLADSQENQWNENVNTPPFLRSIQVDLPTPASTSLPNLSLSEPRAQRIFLGDKSLVNFTVKLNHVGECKTANVALKANGLAIFNREVTLDKQPESILLQAQWEADPGLWVRGDAVVAGTPDALAGDNQVFFSLPPVVEGKVAVLAQSPHLRLALSPEVMRGRWVARTLEPSRLVDEVAAEQDADVLVMESNYLQSGDARKLLWRYLTNGRGALLVINRLTPAISGALRELGFEPEAEADMTKLPGGVERFQFVAANHPIFHPFLSPDYGNLMDIKISKYVRLKSGQAMPLVFSEKGDALFFQSTKLQGKLFVAAFGLDREHTSWPVHSTFVPFLDLTLQAARAEDLTPSNFEPGEIAVVEAPAGKGTREAVLRDDQRELARVQFDHDRAQVPLPRQPGLYTLSYDGSQQPEKMFSVNPSPKESQLVYASDPEAVKLWRMDSPAASVRGSAAAAPASISLRGILQQRAWWWLLLGGLAALALEMLLASMKRIEVSTASK